MKEHPPVPAFAVHRAHQHMPPLPSRTVMPFLHVVGRLHERCSVVRFGVVGEPSRGMQRDPVVPSDLAVGGNRTLAG
jgi:hypothetical protein